MAIQNTSLLQCEISGRSTHSLPLAKTHHTAFPWTNTLYVPALKPAPELADTALWVGDPQFHIHFYGLQSAGNKRILPAVLLYLNSLLMGK